LVALGAAAASTPAVAADTGSTAAVQSVQAPSGVLLSARAWDW